MEILNLAQVAGLERGQWLIARQGRVGKDTTDVARNSLSLFGRVKHFFGFGEAGYYTLKSAVDRVAEQRFQEIIDSFQGCTAPKDLLSVPLAGLPDIRAAFVQIAQVQKEHAAAQKKLDGLFKVDNWMSNCISGVVRIICEIFKTSLKMISPAPEERGWDGLSWMNWAKDDREACLQSFYEQRIEKLMGNKRFISLGSNEGYKVLFNVDPVTFAPSLYLTDRAENTLGHCSFYPLMNAQFMDGASLGLVKPEHIEFFYNLVTGLRSGLFENPDPVPMDRLRSGSLSVYPVNPHLEMSEDEALELSLWAQNFYRDTSEDRRLLFCLPDISKAQAAVQRVLNPSLI